MKLLMVSVGRGRYAVSADAVTRIVERGRGDRGPGRQPGGEALLDGESCASVDLHTMTGETPEGPGVDLLITASRGRVLVAVDEAEAILEIPPSAIAPLPPFIFAGERRLFRGLVEGGTRPRLLLDEECLL